MAGVSYKLYYKGEWWGDFESPKEAARDVRHFTMTVGPQVFRKLEAILRPMKPPRTEEQLRSLADRYFQPDPAGFELRASDGTVVPFSRYLSD